MNPPSSARSRTRYIAVDQAQPGMLLAQPVRESHMLAILPAGTFLTEENIRQLRVHGAEILAIAKEDTRTPEEIAVHARDAARDVLRLFRNADITDPPMAALFNSVLTYRSV